MTEVSVIIPAYNAAATLRRALDSALSQDFSAREIIVVNDGSTDATGEILLEYAGRVTVIAQPNRGQSAARNAAIAAARGEYLAFLDADDYWLPGRLSEGVGALRSNEAGLALCDVRIVDRETGRVIIEGRLGRAPQKSDIFDSWPPMTPSAVTVRADVARECGGFLENIKWGEDVLFWLAVIHRRPFAYVPRVLAVYHASESLSERRYPLRQRRRFEREVISRYGAQGRKLARLSREMYASLLLSSAITDLKRYRFGRALCDLAVLLVYRPRHIGRALRARTGAGTAPAAPVYRR